MSTYSVNFDAPTHDPLVRDYAPEQRGFADDASRNGPGSFDQLPRSCEPKLFIRHGRKYHRAWTLRLICIFDDRRHHRRNRRLGITRATSKYATILDQRIK